MSSHGGNGGKDGYDFDYDGDSVTSDHKGPSTITGELPTLADKAQVVVLVGEGVGRKFLVEEELEIGRNPTAEITVSEGDVSRRHARISRRDAFTFVIEDLGSRNGTAVNGKPIHEHELRFGDLIRVGFNTVLLFTHDDTAQQRLVHLQKMETIGELAGGVAHEFNNLLAVVLNNLSYLERLLQPTEKEGHACIAEAKMAVVRGGEISRQLLDFARLGRFEESPTDISGLMQQVVNLVERTFPPSISVSHEIERRTVVRGNRLQLFQVLLNLCLNARDAMPAGGALHLVVRTDHVGAELVTTLPDLEVGDHAVLMVSDTGSGMSADALERVFDPFYTTKEPGKGTGLGLSVAYSTINAHGGAIKAESVEGQGSTFTIYLPRTSAPEAVEAPQVTLDPGSVSSGRILLVDDDPAVLKSTTRLLRTLGHEVVCAADGSEAIQLYEQEEHPFQLVILDMLMPVMGGEETFRRLRAVDPAVRVLLTSGHTREEHVEGLLASGAFGFLPKPLDPEEARYIISMALEGRSVAQP